MKGLTELLSVFVLVTLAFGPAAADHVSVTIDLPHSSEYSITAEQQGQRIAFDECGYVMTPGCPMLPTRTVLVGLPPGARVRSVEVERAGGQEFAGTFRVVPAPIPVSLASRDTHSEHRDRMGLHHSFRDDGVYCSDDAYPAEAASVTASGSLRGYGYVAIRVSPCAYHSLSGRLICYTSADITVEYELPAPGGAEAAMLESARSQALSDRSGGDRASELFINFDEVRDLYGPDGDAPEATLATYDYVIITTSGLSGAVTASNFVSWKTMLGYSVRIVLVTDPEIAGQSGGDLAEQIRNFLRAYYITWGIEYVLMVGDYATVPMRYCYPDSSNHTSTVGTPGGPGGEVPTDYYYADLSSSDADSWDSDGDGYHGEYGQDNVDLMPEVYVGRIPIDNSTRITYALDKTVTFEQDTGAWKNNALHAGAFWYFTHELSDTTPAMDAAHYLSYIEDDIMSGWTVSKYTEQAGLEASAYPGTPLTHAALTTDWRTGQYAVMNWGAHGWTNSVARKVWELDDGDGIPENHEFGWPDMVALWSNLDDDYPSIVTSASCLVGYPEPNASGNLAIDMLTLQSWGPSVGIISSARSPYGTSSWPPGGSESIIYEFNDLMINGSQKVGQAFYNSKFFCNSNYGWDHYADYINMFTFNLFGDPSLTREGIDVAGLPPASTGEKLTRLARLIASPSPAAQDVGVRYYIPSESPVRLEVFDVTGRRVRTFSGLPSGRGWHETTWDRCSDEGRPVSSGIYWMRLSLPDQARTASIICLR